MVEEKSKVERQRMAWVILLGSFTVCMIITIAIPITANALVQNLTESLAIFVQANQGTVGIDNATGDRTALLAGEGGVVIAPGERVLTGDTASALIAVNPPNVQDLVARLQVYSSTDLTLLEAATPRFGVSDRENMLSFRLDNGRIRLTVPDFGERPSQILIVSPQSDITIQTPGQYTIIVNNDETQVAVQAGEVTVTAVDGSNPLRLAENQRGVVPTGASPQGPLETERNLLINGDFSQELNRWTVFPWTVERADQPAGQVRVLDAGDEPRLNIIREGVGHADVLVRQSVNQDVAEIESLRLLVTFRIINQSLEVCGIAGSECPLFVRVNYVDGSGFSNTWQHGFYAVGDPIPGVQPDGCTTCAMVQDTHERVPLSQEYFYDIDLGEEIARQGRSTPRFIESIILVSSGHNFEVEVVDVALLAAD
ncbi:hypothetical protein [Candidatus Leptofilum sp.]|uniref:hypothetical protein n=1 Tax=Candidatus Leptofilum sp. TaxID=3241576 RepID=UPI003B5D0281